MYVLLLQDLQRHIRTQEIAATMAAAMGAQVEMPDENAILAEFDEAMRAGPPDDTDDPDRLTLLRALGLRD